MKTEKGRIVCGGCGSHVDVVTVFPDHRCPSCSDAAGAARFVFRVAYGADVLELTVHNMGSEWFTVREMAIAKHKEDSAKAEKKPGIWRRIRRIVSR